MTLLAIWAMVAIPVTMATAGHLYGSKNLHTLDVLVYAIIIGALWFLIPILFRS